MKHFCKYTDGFGRILSSALIILAVMMITSCSSSDEPKPVDTAGTVVLVYMAANNSLGDSRYDEKDLLEMERAVNAGALRDGRLLVFHADANGQSTLMEITTSGWKVLVDYSDRGLSSVTSEGMRTVLSDVQRLAPSECFGLVLWSHGYGWLQNGLDDSAVKRTWGDERYRKMNITTLAAVLDDYNPDFVYFDCCYMATIEVFYELAHCTRYIVASPSELPAEGMPYHLTLPFMFGEEGPDLCGAARVTFEYFDAKTDSSDRTCTITVFDTERISHLAALTRNIYLQASETWPSGYSPQQYMLSSQCYFYDLRDYVRRLCDDRTDGVQVFAEWDREFTSCVKYSAHTDYLWNRLPMGRSHGVSTYIFRSEDETRINNYNTLSWPQYTWNL